MVVETKGRWVGELWKDEGLAYHTPKSAKKEGLARKVASFGTSHVQVLEKASLRSLAAGPGCWGGVSLARVVHASGWLEAPSCKNSVWRVNWPESYK